MSDRVFLPHPEAEFKISELLGPSPKGSYEPSGVCFRGGCLYVVFDNFPHIARLGYPLAVSDPANVLVRQDGKNRDFEGITYFEPKRCFLIISEALKGPGGDDRPAVEAYDDSLQPQRSKWLDFAVDKRNKGMEGITYARLDGQDSVLCLYEGNKARGGAKGRQPGGGRIHVYQADATNKWGYRRTLKLPKTVRFIDYSGMDVDGARIAVVSQDSSALWIGELRGDGLGFLDDGRIFHFPRDDSGKRIYCNVEGVAWITPEEITVVSDRRNKDRQKRRCKRKAQSIHIFRIPGAA
jgi:hypothetical protein